MNTAKYLDPKNDLTFRKIFGQHPNIMKSFLNSMLPFEDNRYITELEYQDPSLLPELPHLKHSVVDVRCTDNLGRNFIVEMQMYWSSAFKNRMLFNAGKAYVRQIDRGGQYSELRPVYGLSLVDDIFLPEPKYKNKFYHHYRLAHQEIPHEEIKGIELIFVELPKFTPKTFTEKRMRNLWLRFLTEINEHTTRVPKDLSSEKDIQDALEQLQVSAFSNAELDYYDRYWDRIRIERSSLQEATEKGIMQGMKQSGDTLKKVQEQREEAEKQREEAEKRREEAEKQREEANKQREEAETQQKKAEQTGKLAHIKLAAKMKKYGESTQEIMQETGLSEEEISKL